MLLGRRFDLLGVAGRGGMGTVHRARDRETGTTVAVKVLRDVRSTDGARRFAREARLLGELRHPAIVRYIASGVDGDDAWLAMEWLDGEDLGARIARGPLGRDETVALGSRIAEALGAAHAAGVVHRDVKPANVLLSERGPVLIDFGIARLVETAAPTGRLVGTPGYFAPEQAAHGRTIDARADVFALGAVMYECLTGRPAFEAREPAALLAQVLLEDPPRASAVRPEIGSELDGLLARMLAKDPDARPSDGTAIARELASLNAAAATPPPLGAHDEPIATVVFVRTTSGTQDEGDGAMDLAAARRIAAEHRASLHVLANGALALTVTAGSAAEQAARAGFAGHALAELTKLPVGLAFGRDRVDRAAALATEPGAARADADLIALLESLFVVAGDHLVRARERPTVRRTTPFVGREREVTLIDGILRESRDESVARVVTITAEPGLGKTRLADEVVRLCEPHATVLRASGDVAADGAQLLLARRLVRGAPHDVTRHVAAEDRSRIEVFLAEIAGTSSDRPHEMLLAAREDMRLMHGQIARAFGDWLDAECRAAPTIVVLDDVHWGDEASMQLVLAAVRRLESARLTVVAFGRPELETRFPQLLRVAHAHALRLGPLLPRAARQLVESALGSRSTVETVERIVSLGAGNPFFLEELVRTFGAHANAELPATVLATVQAHIARAPAEARRVLRIASVLGRAFGVAALEALLPTEDLAPWLDVLVREELLEPAVDGAYAFRHALVRETAYAVLTAHDRERAHRRAADWLASLPDADPSTVATHYATAGAGAEAASWFLRAGLRALEGGDAALAAKLARSGMVDAEVDVRRDLAWVELEARIWLGELAEAREKLAAALDLAEPGSVAWYRTAFAALMVATQVGDVGGIGEIVQRAAAQPLVPPFDVPQTRLWMIATRFCTSIGRRAEAAAFLARLEQVAELVAPGSSARAYIESGRFYWMSWAAWDPGERHATLPGTSDAFLRADDKVNLRMSYAHEAWSRVSLGDYAAAEVSMTKLLAETAGHPLIAALARAVLVAALAGRAAASEAVAIASEIPAADVFASVYAVIALADAHRRAGDHASAIAAAERAVGLAMPLPPLRANALGALGHARLAGGDARGAEEAAAEAAGIERAHGITVEGHERIHGVLARIRGGDPDLDARIAALAARIEDARLRETYLAHVRAI